MKYFSNLVVLFFNVIFEVHEKYFCLSMSEEIKTFITSPTESVADEIENERNSIVEDDVDLAEIEDKISIHDTEPVQVFSEDLPGTVKETKTLSYDEENLSRTILNGEKNLNGEGRLTETVQDDRDKSSDTVLPDAKLSKEANLNDVEEPDVTDTSSVRKTEVLKWLLKNDDFDKNNIYEYLKDLNETDLQEILKELEHTNFYLSKENEIYEFILSEDAVQNTLDAAKDDEDLTTQDSFIPYPEKCIFARKKLEDTKNKLQSKKDGYSLQLQNLNFELESLNISLKDLKESKEKFDKHIRIGGRHPVTKRVILQKVIKYFDDSIRTKMALTNRYKIQIQGDTMERSKILNQIKAQEKRLESLNMTEFQEAQFEHKKSCRQLAMYKEQLGQFKAKFSPLLQTLSEMKKALEKEENKMEQMKNAVSKLEHLKEVMLTEKTRNNQKVLELKASMRKIKLDPRRHDLPEVIDYAAAKKEHATLMKNIKKWQKKVEASEQEKHLYLNALSKKKN